MNENCSQGLADQLNATCECLSLDDALLDQALRDEGATFGLSELAQSHPHLFSRQAVFVDQTTLEAMASVVAATERVVGLADYQARAVAEASELSRVPMRARGVFLGFDFHLGERGPQLIEVNTNAGGGLLNVLLRRAQRACCEPVQRAFAIGSEPSVDFFSMFRTEWELARGTQPLGRIAIVDDAPETQFLYPEFVLFQRLCQARGVSAVVCDARELAIESGKLVQAGEVIDLVYNRLTDFALTEPQHAALAEAVRADLAVVTPHPRAHALYADKRRLAWLSDANTLRSLGASEADIATLIGHVPATQIVNPADRELLWRERKHLFFKPQAGYGSKAAYRGDKITKGAFEDVLGSAYVAQEIVPPSSRKACVAGETGELKVDVRVFAYAGRAQLVCARLYQGQTTNFRTKGGGFAPVYATPH